MINLESRHIKDLTTPRYEQEVNEGVEYLIDNHTHSGVKWKYDGSETVDELNRDYHNYVIRVLGYECSLDLAIKLSAINRSRW